jgi:iron complex outermembrane recepter protein
MIFGEVRLAIKSVLMSSAISIALVMPVSALAAEVDNGAELEAIIVTARKREEDLQKVPVAITAISDEAIRERTLTELRDIQDVSPNVLFTENSGMKGTSRVFIRGVGENTPFFSIDPAVGIYIDGIPLSRPQGSNLGLMDVERVEVLRGPQGTTFGKNTIGGSINYVSKTPASAFEAAVVGRFGNYDNRSVQAAVSGPLGETLAVRLSAAVNKRDGFIDNTYDGGSLSDLDNWMTRGSLQWRPNGQLTLLLSGDYFERSESSNIPQLLSFNPASPLVSLFDAASFARYGIHPFALALDGDPFRGFHPGGASVRPGQPAIVFTDPLTNRYRIRPGPNASRQRIWGTYLIGTYELTDALSVKSLTSYRKTRSNVWVDSFGTAVPASVNVLEEDAEETSQELQLLGDGLMDGRLNFVAGFFYGLTKTEELGTQWFEPEIMASVFNLSTSRNQSQETISLAGFGNASFMLTEDTQLTAGARWTKDKKDFRRAEFAAFPAGTNIGFGPALTPQRPLPGGAPFIFNGKEDWPAWSGVVAAQKQWTPDVMTYVSWSRGFRSGGFSAVGRSLLEVRPYDPEFVSSWEAGLRSNLLDRRLQLNVTGYWMDYTDRQLSAVIIDTSVTPFVSRQAIFNAGKSEQKGFEVEAAFRPIRQLTLTGAYGLTDAKYEKLDAPLRAGSTVAADLRLKLPQTPKHTANGSATFRTPIGALPGEFSLTASWSYRSKVYYDVGNSEAAAQGGYGLWNARAAWTTADGDLEVAAWVRNLGDKRYRTDGIEVPATFVVGYFGDPRTYGIEITKRFR